MTRLKGSRTGMPWLWTILIILLTTAVVLLLDFSDVIPLHFI